MEKIIPLPFSTRVIKERLNQICYFSFGHNHKGKLPNVVLMIPDGYLYRKIFYTMPVNTCNSA
jgi:hypothetical protein